MKYVFLLTVWFTESGHPDVYVVESGITAAECIAALETYARIDTQGSRGVGSCELDYGEPWTELPVSGVFDFTGKE